MSSRKEQKERLRQERLAKEEQRRRVERRRRRQISAAVGLAAIAGVAVLVALAPWKSGPTAAFAYSSDGVSERVARSGLQAGVGPHVHPKLHVVVRDQTIDVPANMGIGTEHQPLHTHETDGTIHVEGAKEATIGQFMALWGVQFGRDRLGPYLPKGGERVRMWVKEPQGKLFKEISPDPSLKLADKQELYLYFGPPSQTPIAS